MFGYVFKINSLYLLKKVTSDNKKNIDDRQLITHLALIMHHKAMLVFVMYRNHIFVEWTIFPKNEM